MYQKLKMRPLLMFFLHTIHARTHTHTHVHTYTHTRRRAQQQPQGPYANARAKADHIWDVQNAAPMAPTPPNNRLRPEEMPAAGGRGFRDPKGAAPFALHVENAGPLTQAQMQSSQVMLRTS